MEIELKDILRQEAISLIAVLLKNGNSLQSAKQYVNTLLVNVNILSDSSVSDFISIVASEKRKLR